MEIQVITTVKKRESVVANGLSNQQFPSYQIKLRVLQSGYFGGIFPRIVNHSQLAEITPVCS